MRSVVSVLPEKVFPRSCPGFSSPVYRPHPSSRVDGCRYGAGRRVGSVRGNPCVSSGVHADASLEGSLETHSVTLALDFVSPNCSLRAVLSSKHLEEFSGVRLTGEGGNQPRAKGGQSLLCWADTVAARTAARTPSATEVSP